MSTKQGGKDTNRTHWLDERTDTPLIDDYVQRLSSFLDAMADGRIEPNELKTQEARVVALMKTIEPALGDELHEQVTHLLCELSAYNIMHTIHQVMSHGPRPSSAGRRSARACPTRTPHKLSPRPWGSGGLEGRAHLRPFAPAEPKSQCVAQLFFPPGDQCLNPPAVMAEIGNDDVHKEVILREALRSAGSIAHTRLTRIFQGATLNQGGAMARVVTCPSCRSKTSVPEGAQAVRVRCPKCGRTIDIKPASQTGAGTPNQAGPGLARGPAAAVQPLYSEPEAVHPLTPLSHVGVARDSTRQAVGAALRTIADLYAVLGGAGLPWSRSSGW